MMWANWWIWLIAGIAFAFLELVLPAYVFLGFAIGAVITGLLFLVGGPLSAWMGGSFPVTILIFAVISLVAWLVLRRAMGIRDGQVKTFDRDINED
ncbi:MAG: hypothetical protein AAFR35_09290 [Pseudomonadota bacterium]